MPCCRNWIPLIALVACLPGLAAAQPVAATIDATRTAAPITRLVFGGFMEPATTGAWAGMGRFGGPPVTVAESTLPAAPGKVTLPPASMTVYAFGAK